MTAPPPGASGPDRSAARDRPEPTMGWCVGHSLVLAIPVMVVFWVGLMAATADVTHGAYGTLIAMGAGVGALAGVFWGAWLGVVRFGNEDPHHHHGHASHA